MNFGVYGILVIFGAFVVLLILNPSISCFGKRLKSPFYPLKRRQQQQRARKLKTEDYGFDLGGDRSREKTRPSAPGRTAHKRLKTEDYGFNLGNGPEAADSGGSSSPSKESSETNPMPTKPGE